MSTERFANSAQTSLASAVTAGGTSIAVVNADDFPTSPQFRIRIGDELLLVTAVAGTDWTVTRGLEGTTAVAHESGSTVTQVLTAGVMDSLSEVASDQSANTVFAGPTSGGSAIPTFRSMVAADLPGGNWITSTTSSSVLDQNYTLSASSGTWVAPTGSGGSFVEVSLTAGTWLVTANIRALQQQSTGNGFVFCRLVNATDTTTITDSERLVSVTSSSAGTNGANGVTTAVITVASTKTIRVEVMRSTGGSFNGNGTIGSDSSGRTALYAVKLAA